MGGKFEVRGKGSGLPVAPSPPLIGQAKADRAVLDSGLCVGEGGGMKGGVQANREAL